ncbi:peptide-methionine (R)-S-oxide reductase MsrB [Thiohalophilus sp.]|uniref:peptide-methionine (R)-S-oxide reductase MsrB n=1 Tax=Thiohalophilus sp. TaxID=3028392 RepID=UPI002ACE2DEA|nr:peptide-methionine (R)-S-oxide reductase MsrB [Thiohalophilus sp.]MDZ7661674.1 peptide-methionine (R)-S-oxide reductase MsrB [Thiohalophilus sp.]
MNRRRFIIQLAGITSATLLAPRMLLSAGERQAAIEKISKSEAQWKRILTPEEFHILREDGTEPAHTSPLNDEKRKGTYVCAGCALPLFTSEMKYDSGTGWPSFTTTLPGAVETSLDFKLVWPRTEYHCARCEGHQGHVFDDGPPPTGQRWCNNGLALNFIPD